MRYPSPSASLARSPGIILFGLRIVGGSVNLIKGSQCLLNSRFVLLSLLLPGMVLMAPQRAQPSAPRICDNVPCWVSWTFLPAELMPSAHLLTALSAKIWILRVGRQPGCFPMSIQRLSNRCGTHAWGCSWLIAVCVCYLSGVERLHEGIRVFQEGICIPFQVLFFRFKKKQLTFQNVKESAYCLTLGKKKIIPNHANICSMLLFKSQVTQGLRTWVLALQVIFCIVPRPWKMFFNCTVIQKQDLGVVGFFYK